jgi:hypothetical protein
MATHAQLEYTVRFSRFARVLECDGPAGRIDFTFDGSAKGAKTLVLEHHAPNTQRSPQYDAAFQSAKQFLESCGYEVDIHGK